MTSTTASAPTIDREDVSDYPHWAQQQILANGNDRQRLRANASLPKEAWISVDETVYPAMDDVLVVYNDLVSAGLTTGADIMNKSVEWHKQDYSAEANVGMNPEGETDEAHGEYDLTGAPLPVVYSDFSIGWRDDGGARSGDIETLGADASGRAVAEAVEDLTLNGWAPTISGEGADADGYSMYGLTNHPSVHGGTLADWTTNPNEIDTDLKGMARDLKDDNFRPGNSGYNVYIGSDLEDPLSRPDSDFNSEQTVRTTLNEVVPEINQIKVSDFMDPDAALMFRPTPDVVDLAVALDTTVVQWDGPFRDNFKTITGFTPRVKDTLRGQCGIAYYTGGTST